MPNRIDLPNRIEIEIRKEKPNRNSGIERYNNSNAKFTRGAQQICSDRKGNKQTSKYVKWDDLILKTKRKMSEINPQRLRDLWDTRKHTNKFIIRIWR